MTEAHDPPEVTAGADRLAWDIFRFDNDNLPEENLKKDFPREAGYALNIAKHLREAGYVRLSPGPTQTTVFLTGDEDGPDLHGLVYDLQDDAMESARENDRTAWQVKALLLPGTAIKLESDSDGG